MRRLDPFDKRAAVLSFGMHVLLLVLAWTAGLRRPPPYEFAAIEVELVSPPPATQAEEPQLPTEELVIERPREPEPLPPEPEPEPELPEPEVEPIEEPEPTPPEPEAEPEPPPPDADQQDVPAVTPEPPEVEREDSGEGLNVRLEGLRRDYPEYYNNIIRQINNCFRWRAGGSWETTVVFTIGRDGAATGLEFLSRSGNTAFDFEAMGAVDCAGRGRFGPLPEDYPFEALRISFTFSPSE